MQARKTKFPSRNGSIVCTWQLYRASIQVKNRTYKIEHFTIKSISFRERGREFEQSRARDNLSPCKIKKIKIKNQGRFCQTLECFKESCHHIHTKTTSFSSSIIQETTKSQKHAQENISETQRVGISPHCATRIMVCWIVGYWSSPQISLQSLKISHSAKAKTNPAAAHGIWYL